MELESVKGALEGRRVQFPRNKGQDAALRFSIVNAEMLLMH